MKLYNATKRAITLFLTISVILTIVGCSRVESVVDTVIETATDILGTQEQEETTLTFVEDEDGNYVVSKNGYSVSTASEEATMVGVAVLESGGNAVDAAIAIAYTLGVVEPYGSGIGGGGGMLIYDPDNDDFTFVNFMSTAAQSGAKSNNISVPGFVAGMELAYDLYGTIDFAELLSYAIDYAENGFVCGSELAARAAAYNGYFSSSNPFYNISQGDIIIQTELAETMKAIAAEGSAAFYTGSIAEKIAAATSLKASDLAAYEAYTDEAVVSTVAGYTIASAPAPFSGLTVIQMLKLMELMEVPDPNEDTATYISNLITIKLATGSVRAGTICDVKYTGKTIDYDTLLSTSYLSELVNTEFGDEDLDEEGEDTTHLSVVDSSGMAVSMTTTLSQFWGSKTYVAGFFMGNNLKNFTTGINAYAAGKTSRTFMSPTILIGDNGDVMAVGSPGGKVIPSVIVSVVSDIILYGTDAQDAVNKARIFVRSKNTIVVESGSAFDLIANPSGLGYYVVKNQYARQFGSVNIAGYSTTSGFFATTDPHRLGYGYASNE